MDKIIHHFLNSVIAIGTPDNNNNIAWIGTGFIVSKRDSDTKETSFYIITNKHVLENIDVICARFNTLTKDFVKDYTFKLKDRNNNFLFSKHLNDEIDILAMRFNPDNFNNDKVIWRAISLEDQSLTLNQMKNNEMLEGTIVYALGFPMSLVEDVKTPICRLGCISRIRNTYFNKDDYPTYLVDAQAYPGNSGSPIISDYKLIGILNANITQNTILVNQQTGRPQMLLTENRGLTYVFPVDRIKEVVDLEFNRTKKQV